MHEECKEDYKNCFRPLAGFWFLNEGEEMDLYEVDVVSVPLRGSGS